MAEGYSEAVSARLREGAMLEPRGWRHRIRRGLTLLMAAAAGIGNVVAAESVTTYHGAANRSGLYVAPALTWTKAATVRLDTGFHATVDGKVYSQPLYWVPPGAGGAARIIVATENNFVYALDASTGKQIWAKSLGAPVPRSALPCGNIDPMGVTGTPVIDPVAEIVYLEAYVVTASGPRHFVFGLSLATGAIAAGWPVDVGKGLAALKHSFDETPQGQRSALALINGNLYVPYAGHFGDCGVYNGPLLPEGLSCYISSGKRERNRHKYHATQRVDQGCRLLSNLVIDQRWGRQGQPEAPAAGRRSLRLERGLRARC
jgi:hypothetical protein